MYDRGLSLEAALQLGRESKHLEFKAAGSIATPGLLLKVTRAMLAMANNQDGGTVIVGIDDDGSPSGVAEADAKTWEFEAVSEQVAKFADPYVTFEVEIVEFDSKFFVRFYVFEFEQVPVVCKSVGCYQENGKNKEILKAGAIYVRPRRKPESVPVPGQTEMREILDLAIEKGLRKAYRLVEAAGTQVTAEKTRERDDASFRRQVGEL